MTDLDTRLRALAVESLDRAAADVDVERDLAAVLGRAERPVSVAPSRGAARFAVAAAVVALVAGAAVLLVSRRGDDGSDEVATVAPGTTAPAFAAISRTEVGPGQTVSITPASPVTRITCMGLVRVEQDGRLVGHISPGGWVAFDPEGPVPACEGRASDGTRTIVVPDDLAAGGYRLCIGLDAAPEGCADLTVTDIGRSTSSAPSSRAMAGPAVVVPGSSVSVTPAAAVEYPGCADPYAQIERLDGDRLLLVGTMWDENFELGLGVVDCGLVSSTSARAVTMPRQLGPGTYRVCISLPVVPDGCALVEVADSVGTTVAETTTTAVAPPMVAPVLGEAFLIASGFFAREYLDDPSGVTIRQYGADGTDMGTLTPEEVDQLLRREQVVLPDGSSLRLDRSDEFDGRRCTNVSLIGDGPDGERMAAAIGSVRSVAATVEVGSIFVGRDVCPLGTRWGDPGTRFELLAWDATDPGGEPVLLVDRDPDPLLLFFDDGVVVYAGGELKVESVSPDGRYVAVADLYSTEHVRYHVIDAVAGGEPIEFGSGCDDPFEIAGPPQFVGNSLVVLPRSCSPVGLQPGDLVVDVVDLETRSPIWSVAVDHVAISSYSWTVSSSARLIDGEVWVLVSGSGGVEQPLRSAVVTRDGAVDLPYESLLAFTPAELIESWDPAAS